MRENFMRGSARGAPSDRCSYRDCINMIKFIRDLNKERKRLPRRLKIVDALLAGGSGVVAIIFMMYLLVFCHSVTACKDVISNDLTFWVSFIPAFILSLQVGQMVIIGSFTLILRLLGRLSTKEAVRYSLLYRVPTSWLKDNA